ncbi:uncharacterized protein LOC129808045 [Phlebotomus papatasi]|uniref:uncharacterized protein LOC129808045 n=1 Tax=Phlebotomus papatasi TaxID=29031 RepID=UPI002483B456|nr:uncharacterized protein LOC129808045 [Phlebotomus papatasi]
MLQNRAIILVVLLGLIFECWGQWCDIPEVEYVWEKRKVNVIKYRDKWVKCHWFSVNRSCKKREQYPDTEWKDELVRKVVTKRVCCAGYSEELGECVPICENSCINSRCVAPNTCQCNIGYKIFSKEATNKCIPYCDECDFGTCIAPNVCKCASGYKKQWSFAKHKDLCVPFCEDDCPRRSVCSQPNICKCLEPFMEVNFLGEMLCLAEGETLEPPTTTTEATTTTTTEVITTTTTEEITTTTTEPSTSTLTSTTTPVIEETTTLSSSTLRTTDFSNDSTDYSDIEEVPEEDLENSTLSAQLNDAENDLENVSDDIPSSSTINAHVLDVFEESVESDGNGTLNNVFGMVWYIVLAIAIILFIIIALKIYIAMQTKHYKIPNELPEVHYTNSKV